MNAELDRIDELFADLWDHFSAEADKARQKHPESALPVIEDMSNRILHMKCAMQVAHRTVAGELLPTDVSRLHRLSGDAKRIDVIRHGCESSKSKLYWFAVHGGPVRFKGLSGRSYAGLIWELFHQHLTTLVSNTTRFPETPSFGKYHVIDMFDQIECIYTEAGFVKTSEEMNSLLKQMGFVQPDPKPASDDVATVALKADHSDYQAMRNLHSLKVERPRGQVADILQQNHLVVITDPAAKKLYQALRKNRQRFIEDREQTLIGFAIEHVQKTSTSSNPILVANSLLKHLRRKGITLEKLKNGSV